MGVDLALYRMRIGSFCPVTKRQEPSKPVLRLIKAGMCRLVITLFVVSTALAVSGDIESNPGPNRRICAACGYKDVKGLTYFSFPLNRLVTHCNTKSEYYFIN